MSSIIFILIFIGIFCKDSTKDRLKSDLFKWIILSSIGLSILSSLFGGPFGLIALIAIIVHFSKKHANKNKEKERSEQFGFDASEFARNAQNAFAQNAQRQTYQSSSAQNRSQQTGSFDSSSFGKNGKGNSLVLPRSVKKRKKVLSQFNARFSLYLTEEQIQSIVNSSYMSDTWKTELEAMTLHYETVYEWFQGNTDWLRAYMYVFHVQEITSDIKQQEKICIYAYEEIFRYVDELGSIPLYEKIQRVNSKYFTAFDDVSFMIAYRFLEKKGLYHTLESPDIVRNDSEIDELLEKYKTGVSQQ